MVLLWNAELFSSKRRVELKIENGQLKIWCSMLSSIMLLPRLMLTAYSWEPISDGWWLCFI